MKTVAVATGKSPTDVLSALESAGVNVITVRGSGPSLGTIIATEIVLADEKDEAAAVKILANFHPVTVVKPPTVEEIAARVSALEAKVIEAWK